MRPELAELVLGDRLRLVLPAYGSFLALGFLLAFVVAIQRRRSLGLGRGEVFDFGSLTVLVGILGAHLLHVALNPGRYLAGFDGTLRGLGMTMLRIVLPLEGGLIYYGGLVGAVVFLLLYSRKRRLGFIDLLDFMAPVGCLGLAVTRVGCFLNGCCYGRPSSLPWAVSYPPGSLPHVEQRVFGLVGADEASLPIHPVQLYELVVATALFAILWLWYPRRRFAGEISLAFLCGYAAWRTVAEMLRADGRPVSGVQFLPPMTRLQLLSVLVLAASATVFAWRAARAPRARADSAGPVGDSA